MLDPWIIEQIRRREEEERRRNERPVLELPVSDIPRWPPQKESGEAERDRDRDRREDDEPQRGVVIIGM